MSEGSSGLPDTPPLASSTLLQSPGPSENVSPATSKKSASVKSPPLDCPQCPDEDFASFDKSQSGKPDATNTEFVYYSATLREVAPRLTNEVDRTYIIPWIRKLFRPEYHSPRFRVKRNKYLLSLALFLMNDEAWGIFKSPPPQGALLEPYELALKEELPWLPEWERDNMWSEVLSGIPSELNSMPCSVHATSDACRRDKANGKQLDEEFRYFLYLARPFCVLLRSAAERTRAAAWLQSLCTIRPDACSAMKQIRNDYCTALLGYVNELRAPGPFAETPWQILPPLAEAARILAERKPTLDPCAFDSEDFLSSQPVPDEGAFCYLAISGELLESSLNELD